MPPFYIKCSTADCETPTLRHAADDPEAFTAEADALGWVNTPHGWLCPACAQPDDDSDERPVLSIPVSVGVFAASVPVGMTYKDWARVRDVAGVLAGGADDAN